MQDLVKQKIIELVPSVLELKVGCSVKWKDAGVGTISKVEYGGYYSTINGGALKMNHRDQIEEVIGSPITLPIVLQAIMKQNFEGNQYTAMSSKQVVDILRLWILSENYDTQNQEFKDFLGSLLGV